MHVDIVRSIFFDISYSKLKCQTVVHNSERLLERHLEEFEGLGTGQLIRGRLNSLIFIFKNEKCLPVNSPGGHQYYSNLNERKNEASHFRRNQYPYLTNSRSKYAIEKNVVVHSHLERVKNFMNSSLASMQPKPKK